MQKKKIWILIAILTGLALTAYKTMAKKNEISLNSATTFPVDI